MITKHVRFLLYVFVILIFSKCKQNTVKQYYSNGKLKLVYEINNFQEKNGEYIEFFKSGNIKLRHYFLNNKKINTSFYYFDKPNNYVEKIVYHDDSISSQKSYYENNKLKSEGKLINDSLPIGNWFFYDSLGFKTKSFEYLRIKNKKHLNQFWFFNKKGDTIGGNYYSVKMKDSIFTGEISRIYFHLSRYSISEKSELFLCLPSPGYNLKEDFSNVNFIKWDTINNLAFRFRNRDQFQDRNHDIVFDVRHKEKGIKYLRGFLLEKSETKNDSIFDYLVRKIYFNKLYYVKGK